MGDASCPKWCKRSVGIDPKKGWQKRHVWASFWRWWSVKVFESEVGESVWAVLSFLTATSTCSLTVVFGTVC